MKSLQRYIYSKFKKTKLKAIEMIKNGYDTTEIVNSIKETRKSLGQIARPITDNEIAQILAIRIYKK